MKSVLFICILGFSSLSIFAQAGQKELTINKLSFLKGSWSGTLEAQDGNTQESARNTDLQAEFSRKGKKIKYLWEYSGADGKPVEEKGKIKVSKDGRSVQFGSESFKVSNFVPAPKEDRYRLILTRQEGPATYRTSFFLSEGKLMINMESRVSEEGAEYQSVRRLFLREE